MKNLNLKINLSIALRYLYILIFLLILTAFGVLSWFLYQNFYQTISQTETIILLRKEVAPDTVNVKQVEEFLSYLDKKNNTYGIKTQEIANIFSDRSSQIEINPEEEGEELIDEVIVE